VRKKDVVNGLPGTASKSNCAGKGQWQFTWDQALQPMSMIMSSQKPP
jgi:hypothetical protein